MEARLSDTPTLSWQTRTIPQGAPEALAKGHHLPSLVANVLAARGWTPGQELAAFLGERTPTVPDALDLVGVPVAATRLWQAIDAGEPITVCGDYDVDGVTGAALLVAVLRAAGAQVDTFLPHRYHGGYGLNTAALDDLAGRGTKVLVTVDNGTSSIAELQYARDLGMDAIVTDHHLPGPELPDVVAIVNPRLMAEPGPFDPLAGVGVAYQLMRGLAALRPERTDLPAIVERQVDLVAIGTIGDMAPLSGENRRLVRLGLSMIARTPRLGIALLAKSVKASLDAAETIAHRLIPRLNAAGRMANAGLALDLLLAEDEGTARALVEKLDQLNRQRRVLTEATEARCIDLLRRDKQPAVALHEAGWHHGVTGIVAARMAERFGKPALLFAPDGDNWRGSGRSVPGFDLHAVLDELADHLVRYGGHAAAVGVTVADDKLEGFIKAFQACVARRRAGEPTGPRGWEVDLEVPLEALTLPDVQGLACLEPTGMHNPVPRLAARGLKVVRQGTRGPQGQHLWLELAGDEGGPTLEAIGFNMGSLHPVGDRVDAVFTPVAERWHGKQRLQLKLAAIGALA
ncbi:MAG: Single-stranded-DNA-specific exonuclease RecJ [Cyanobacteria bacterium RYN_339]|nr:Single-stranded-DNA-specific exonuclease RecJ [Cyanobacteria bacterium RYN_339]